MQQNQDKKYSLRQVIIILLAFLITVVVLDIRGLYNWAQRLELGTFRDYALTTLKPFYNFSREHDLDIPKKSLEEFSYIVTDKEKDAGWTTSIISTSDGAKADTVIIKARPARIRMKYSSSQKLKVLLVGDSMMGTELGGYLLNSINKDSAMSARLYYKYSSGLARNDYYNWQAQIVDLTSRNNYDMAVVMMGTNDAQHFSYNGKGFRYGTPEWIEQYSKLMRRFIGYLSTHTKKVYWLGMPPMRETAFQAKMNLIGSISREVCGSFKNVIYVDTSPFVGDEKGKYATFMIIDNHQKRIRAGDGIHFALTGARLIGEAIADSIASYVYL